MNGNISVKWIMKRDRESDREREPQLYAVIQMNNKTCSVKKPDTKTNKILLEFIYMKCQKITKYSQTETD